MDTMSLSPRRANFPAALNFPKGSEQEIVRRGDGDIGRKMLARAR